MILPNKVFLTKGVGTHREKLPSFELALRNAGVAPFNIVRVSSIYPPYCKLISRDAGLKYLTAGQVLFTVVAECSTNEPNRLIAASVGMAIPKNAEHYGYLSEFHTYGWTEKKTGEYFTVPTNLYETLQ